MLTIKIELRNSNESTAQDVLNFVLRQLEKEGMKNDIESAEIVKPLEG